MKDLPAPAARRAPRYSQDPLPSYRYVPGLHPHPIRDPAGHSFGVPMRRRAARRWSPDEWRDLPEWLYGVDLFNAFYFWEAHEAWEGLWATAPHHSAQRRLLQGLIQVAAALLKIHLAVLPGAQRLARDALAKIAAVGAMQAHLMGLPVLDLEREWRAYFEPLQAEKFPLIGEGVPVLRLTK